MAKITFVIPYPEIRPVVESTFAEQDGSGWEIDIVLSTGVKALANQHIITDVVVARGVTATALKRMLPETPVVDLPVSGYDILRAIKECQTRFGARRIGVVGSMDMIYGAKSIEDILDVELDVVGVWDEDDAEPSIRMLRDSGINVIVGGVMSTKIAQQMGIGAVFIQIGREAVYQSIREAKRVVQISRQERARSGQFRAILNYSSEGIVAVDADGTINIVNTAAFNLTRLREDSVGKPIAMALPEFHLNKVITSGKAEIGEIITVDGQQLAVNRVPIIVDNDTVGAVATFQPIAAIQELEGKIREKIHRRGHVARNRFSDILGESQEIRRTISLAEEFSKVDSSVLIMGETGTGKEIFAQSIHNAGGRNRGPFVAVNCAALPENLLESELFGYAEGAFTGAARGGKMGLFELAHRGTILLDEISEISPKLQGRLLRVLQEREIMRLGDDRLIPVDVRITAATNRDLYTLMQDGLFRADLYYRLNILMLEIPPLRDRRVDIMPLFRHFLDLYCGRFNKKNKVVSSAAQEKLSSYDWPGNVRELRNVAERLAVVGGAVEIDVAAVEAVLPRAGARRLETLTLQSALDREILYKTLEQVQFHYGKAAAQLGISRTTLWRRMKQLEQIK